MLSICPLVFLVIVVSNSGKPMERRKHAQIAILAGILLLLGLWICFGLLMPPSPREQVQSIIDNSLRERWDSEHTAKLLVQGPINPYPYLNEILHEKQSAMDEGYLTLLMKFPKEVSKRLARPIPIQQKTNFTLSVIADGCKFDRNIDRILALAQEQDTNITHLVDVGLSWRWPTGEDKWTYESLLESLDSPTRSVRNFAFSTFQITGPKGLAYDPKLDKFLYHTNESIALNAAVTIHCIGGDTNRTIPVLEKLLDSKSDEVRFWAACQMLFVSRNHPKPADVFTDLIINRRAGDMIQWQAFNYLPYCGNYAIPHLPKIKAYVTANSARLEDVARVAVIRIEKQNERDVSGPLDFIRHIPLARYNPPLP